MGRKRLNITISSCPGFAEDSHSLSVLHRVFTTEEKRMLFGLVFRDSELNRVDFSHANLSETEFHRTSLIGADFSRADLRGTSFYGCDLRGARFDHAAIRHTRFDGSWLLGVRGLSEYLLEYVRRRGGLLWAS